ncbi:MAG: hypothetical protein ACPGYK_00990 [Flavobacteriales bacterium]
MMIVSNLNFFSRTISVILVMVLAHDVSGVWTQTSDQGWLERESILHNYDAPIGQEMRPTGDVADVSGDQQALMMPPDPNSQIPLTGFDYMLLLSFVAGGYWLYRQKLQNVVN